MACYLKMIPSHSRTSILAHKVMVQMSIRFRQSRRRSIENLSMKKRIPMPKYQNSLSRLEPLSDILIDGRIDSLEENCRRKLELYKQYLPPNHNTVLLEALLGAKDIDTLLMVIDENLESMNSFLLAVSLEALTDQVRLASASPETILVSPEFKRLSTVLLYKMRYFETDEVLKLLNCLNVLNVPGKKLISQCAFQMTRYLINSFNMKELRHLNELLSKFDNDTNLVSAIRKALPIAYKRQINEKMFVGKDDISRLSLNEIELLNEPIQKMKKK